MTIKKRTLKEQIELLKRLIKLVTELLKKKLKKNEKDYKAFCLAVRKRESGNNYKIVNTLGYLGAYQFGMARLCDLGYTVRSYGSTGYDNDDFRWKFQYSTKAFLGNPKLQDFIFRKHVVNLIKQIEKGFKDSTIERYTMSGMIMGAHLGGIGGIQKFVLGQDTSDAYGTGVSEYVKRFKGYSLS